MNYRLASLAIVQLLAAGAIVLSASDPQARAEITTIWTVPEIGALPRDAHGLQVREGRDLVTATYAYIGPNVPDPSKRYAGNNLACSNCHLEAGTKKFGLPLFGLYNDFPQYSARSGGEISIEDRINSCMTRSMNGRPLSHDAPEMQAIVAYIKFLSTGVARNQRVPGTRHRPNAGASARRSSCTRRTALPSQLRGLSQHRRVRGARQYRRLRPWLRHAAAVGAGQIFNDGAAWRVSST